MVSPTERIIIFDTTLRDGEQSPGVSLRVEEKLEIARLLARMQVDVIEAGFPVASPGDFEAVSTIAQQVQGPIIAALARTSAEDIDVAWEAVKKADKPRIHTFVSTSDIHMRHMLKRTPDQVVQLAVAAVSRARSYTSDVEFSAQDATRSDPQFLYRILSAAIEAGATTVNIPDTVGYTTPREFHDLLKGIFRHVAGIDQVVVSVHCHNDLGLATANSLAGVEAGARQVECAINGIGERAGNTALEEVVMAAHTRRDFYGFATNIVTTHIHRASRLVSSLTGMRVQPNKAVVGANAFAHESGIHQDGVLKEPTTYEIMRPELVGCPAGQLVLGKHSGRHAFRQHLREMGYPVDGSELERLFARFKELADRKREVSDYDLQAIIEEELLPVPEIFRLEDFQVASGKGVMGSAAVRLLGPNGRSAEAAVGDGPVDALYRAIDRAVGSEHRLLDYALQAVTPGTDALGEVTLRLSDGNAITHMGRGVSPDILEASARAYLAAVNKSLASASQPLRGVMAGESG